MSSPRRLRVLMVADWFFYYTAALAAELAKNADVMLLTRDHGRELGIEGDASELKRQLLASEVEMLTIGRKQRDIRVISELLDVRRRIDEFAPDVVHAQPHWDWRLLASAALRPSVQVMTIHDVTPHLGEEVRRNALQQFVHARNLGRSSALIVHGESLVQEVKAQPWYREGQYVKAIPHGPLQQPADARRLPDAPTVLFFGRLETYKGLDVFVSAVERAAERLPALRAIIAGRGGALASARGAIQRPELFDVREAFIPDEELPGLFGECSVVALPYREASQSGVIPLAYANGRGVIATRVGALPDAVEDGVDGVLVDRVEPEAFSQALVSVLSDPVRPGMLGTAALAAVTDGRLSIRRAAAEHVRLYESLLDLHSSEGRL